MKRTHVKRGVVGTGIIGGLLSLILAIHSIFQAGKIHYLPLVFGGLGTSSQGVQEWRGVSSRDVQELNDLRPRAIRFHWGNSEIGDPWTEYKRSGWEVLDQGFKDDFEALQSTGALVIVVIQPAHPDISKCRPLPKTRIPEFAQFVKDFQRRYQIELIDLGNEVDAVGGYPGRFGCHGRRQLLIDTWNAVRDAVPNGIRMGISFMTDHPDKAGFIEAVFPRLNDPDWLGIHHYLYYQGEPTLPGGAAGWDLAPKHAWAVALAGEIEVWITETNTLWPNGSCKLNDPESEDYYEFQLQYIESLKQYEGLKIVYNHTSCPGWACACLNPNVPAWEAWKHSSSNLAYP